MINEQWLKYYKICENYYNINHHLQIPYTYIEDNLSVGHWISKQRKYKKDNKLSEEKIALLTSIKMIWDISDENWFKMYDLAKEYYNEQGDLLIPSRYTIKGIELGDWLRTQRKGYYSSGLHKLSLERQKLLEELDIVWDVKLASWMDYYKEAKKFFKKYNHLYIPVKYVGNGLNVGKWLSSQRTLYRNAIKNEKLSEMQDKVELLEMIGMNWETNKQKNTSFGEQTLYYYLSFCFGDIINRYSDLGFELDIYIPSLKLGIEYDGFIGHQETKRDIEKQKLCESNGISLINIRESRCPNLVGNVCVVDISNLESLKSAITYILEFIELNYLMSFSLDVDILRDSSEIIDMYLKVSSYYWDKMYDLAEKYYKKNHNLLIPYNYIVKDMPLGAWLHRQRQGYKNNNGNRILKTQIERLEKIGMVWNVSEYLWSTTYSLVKENYIEGRIKYNLKIDGKNLYRWWLVQLKKYQNDKLNKEQKKLIGVLIGDNVA